MFSYYKEVKAGEDVTYIHMYGKVHGITPQEALRSLADQTVRVVARIRNLLGEGIERECWEDFAAGYTQFHMHTDRYQLIEIMPEYF